MLLHVATTGSAWPADVPGDRFRILCLSGLVGLVLGDMGYFFALATIGPRISSVLMATWPCMALLLAWGVAGEMPSSGEVQGLLLCTVGVVLVLLRGKDVSAWNRNLTPATRAWAVAGALLGALGQAGGWALSRSAMAATPDLPAGVAPVSAALVRMVAACTGIFALAMLGRRASSFLLVLRDRRALGTAAAGTAFGPVFGVWLSMVAARYSDRSGAAAALIATTPIWMMPVSFFVYRARIGWLGLLGTLITVAGAVLLLREQA
jgi:drug/metabolite transporter (DMT)-like permease